MLIILIVCTALGLLAIGLFAFRILTTVKEFHQEIEIALPLLVSKQDLHILHVKYYDNATEPLRAALARYPAQGRRHIAQLLLSVHDTNAAAANSEIALFGLELIQLLAALLVVRNSAKLLGPQASFRKSREVMQLQSSTVTSQWRELASQVPNNHFLQDSLHAVPQKIILPHGVKLHLSNIRQQISGKVRSKYSSTSGPKEVTLLKAIAGPDTVLAITAITPFSAYGLPRPNMPRRGLTARCILRNARDQRLQELACEEERAAAQLSDDGQALQPANPGQPDPVAYYTSLYNKLYAGGWKPYLLRVFVQINGAFRIRHFSIGKNQKSNYRLYAWGKELSRLLAQIDIEEFLATLKDEGQQIPHRMF